MRHTADPFPGLHCEALWVWSHHRLSWWVRPYTAPQPGACHVPKYDGGAVTGVEGEHLLGDEATAQSVERLTFEHSEGQGL